jgi:hypothetical protein
MFFYIIKDALSYYNDIVSVDLEVVGLTPVYNFVNLLFGKTVC